MQFIIAQTFTDSFDRLMGDEQKSIKATIFDLQINPAHPGLQMHRLERSKDPNFWSLRGSRDLRVIVHKTDASLLVCYVGHHDDAYRWAERRKLERHPKTGAAQLVEIRETVKEIIVPVYKDQQVEKAPGRPIFADRTREELFGFGVPEEWIEDVLQATEESILDLAEHLPQEAAEALLEIAVGGEPFVPQVAAPTADPFEHPDAQRRFRVMSNKEELERALEFPWERWTVFLHPTQRDLVERHYRGPARVAGSAGTGKTVVALHRAVHIARNDPKASVLVTTFTPALAAALKRKLRILVGNEPAVFERLTVRALDSIGVELWTELVGEPKFAEPDTLLAWMTEDAQSVPDLKASPKFLLAEWREVVDPWGLKDWESYKGVRRLGRKTRLREPQRRAMWQVFESVQQRLQEKSLTSIHDVFTGLAAKLESGEVDPPFTHAVVDEAQDISVAQLRFLAALTQGRENALFFSGDLGQRIFQAPFSWGSLGVDIRGRSHTLRINYRTSHQIRRRADLLLPDTVSDLDGNQENRRGTISVFNGPEPEIYCAEDPDAEAAQVVDWVQARIASGIAPEEVALIVRTQDLRPRAEAVTSRIGLPATWISKDTEPAEGHITMCSMHLAKGMEFRAVCVMACDDDVIPLQSRLEQIADEADLEEVYNTERHLLYVACTRARDHLLVVGVNPLSEFAEDLINEKYG